MTNKYGDMCFESRLSNIFPYTIIYDTFNRTMILCQKSGN